MKFEFVTKRMKQSPYMIAEGSLVFGAGLLEGMKLTGFTVWKRGDAISISFPARPYVAEGKTKYHWHLKAVDREDFATTKRLQQHIGAEYEKWKERTHED